MNASTGDFVLPVDKPVGPTSHDVVSRARRALGTRRVGHTGTLDPFASGLLLLCVGRATRLAEYLSGMDKRYVATARLGVSTDTLDSDGEVTSEDENWRGLSDRDVATAVERFRGSIEQVPPQYSAKKVDGEAMHRRARRGETVVLPPVPVTVHRMSLVSLDMPEVTFDVSCSSGTYVRALARDLGNHLGVGAHLTALRRLSVGPFDVADAVSMDRLDDSEVVAEARLEPCFALPHFDRVDVEPPVADRLRNGQRVRIRDIGGDGAEAIAAETLVAVTRGHDLVAVADLSDGVLRPRKVFAA